MPVTKFPDPRDAGPEGILAVGGDLLPETLLLAYEQGIFPWPMPGHPLVWFSPEERGVLEFSRIHVPRSLEKVRKRSPFRLSLNEDFDGVIRHCARIKRAGQKGTWITPAMTRAYIDLHRLGHAQSAEAWDGSTLVGGIYGVAVRGVFSGESMFHLQPNASKLALLHLVQHLGSRGLTWMDIQVTTPHMEALGARLISRDEFLKKLAETQKKRLRLF